MLLLWLSMQLSLFPGPGKVSLAWRNGQRECQTNSSTQSSMRGRNDPLDEVIPAGGHFTGQEKQTAGMYHNEGKKRERAAVYSSHHMWKGGKYSQAPSACKCLLEPRGKAQKGDENWSHHQFHHPAGECQSIWSITCVCRLSPDQFNRSLKSTLLIKEG